MKIIDMRAEFRRATGDFAKRDVRKVKYIAVHHSGDRSAESPSIEAAARAIYNYHRYTKGWSSIGYHGIILRGDIALVGDDDTSRANVLDMNHLVWGLCILGNFTTTCPDEADLYAAGWYINHLQEQYPWWQVKAHYELNPGHTACPGPLWPQWKGRLVESTLPVLSTTPYNTINGFVLGGGFRSRYEALGALAMPTLGLPVSNEETAIVDGTPRTIQKFERGVLGFYPVGTPDGVEPSNPFHIRCLTLEEISRI